jgi:uncharacterized protein (DUF362 family)
MQCSEPVNESRRHFIFRLMQCAVGMGLTGLVGWHFYDPDGPPNALLSSAAQTVPTFTPPAAGPALAVAHGDDRAQTTTAVIKALGGIERFIAAGDRVLLKVNAAFATPARLGATSHPDLVKTVIRLCLQAGARSVAVTDNSINDPASCFALSGIDAAARDAGAAVILPDPAAFEPVSLKGGRLISRWPFWLKPLKQADKLIGLAPVKDHARSGASLTLKNWYGLLGGQRSIFHQDINTIIKELALLVRPTLVVLDGTVSMMTNGPTGGSTADLKTTATMIAGTDGVAVDTYGAALLGHSAADLPYLDLAAQAGVGTTAWRSLNPPIVN